MYVINGRIITEFFSLQLHYGCVLSTNVNSHNAKRPPSSGVPFDIQIFISIFYLKPVSTNFCIIHLTNKDNKLIKLRIRLNVSSFCVPIYNTAALSRVFNSNVLYKLTMYALFINTIVYGHHTRCLYS